MYNRGERVQALRYRTGYKALEHKRGHFITKKVLGDNTSRRIRVERSKHAAFEDAGPY